MTEWDGTTDWYDNACLELEESLCNGEITQLQYSNYMRELDQEYDAYLRDAHIHESSGL